MVTKPDNLQRARLQLDIEAQSAIACRLKEEYDGVTEEEVRLRLDGHANIVSCVVLQLDDSMKIRMSVNGGWILVTVGDDVVQIQRKEWRRSKQGVDRAIGWIFGYIAGFQQ